jgi:hypothetical protein
VVKVLKSSRRKLGIVIISFMILAVVIVVYALPIDFSGWFPNPGYEGKYGVVAETDAQELLPNGTFIRHDPITEEFANRTGGYWNLTDPDRYVLEAINTGKMVLVSIHATDLTIVKQLEEHNWIRIVKYNGKFYLITVLGSPKSKWR